MTLELLERPSRSEFLSDRDWTADTGRRRAASPSTGFDISSSAGPVLLPFGQVKLIFSEPPPAWARELIHRICALGQLSENWDSYGARRIDPRCAMVAINLILSATGPATPTPAIVPTSRGGIQLEWHRNGVDLEIEILSESRLHVSLEDERTGETSERTILPEFQAVAPLLERISTTTD
jgi:hypothetical protein